MKTNRKILYTILLIALLILASVSSFFLYYFYKMRNENLSFNKIDVQESSTVSYNVLANDSKFYDSSVSKKSYITREIKDVQTYFNYILTFSSDISINYSYIIEGKIIGSTKGTDDRILEKTIYKNTPVVKQYSGKIINLTDTFDIDVPYYVQLKDEFVNQYNIDVDAYIEYHITISYAYTSNAINKSKTDKKELSIIIPISEVSTMPVVPLNNIYTHSEYSDLTEKDRSTYLAICLELFGSTMLFILTGILIFKRLISDTEVVLYRKDIKEILSKYKEYVVKLKNMPDFDDIDVLFVDKFQDLYDLCLFTKKPINYFEVLEDKTAIFVIFNDFKAYVYKVNIRNEEE